MKISDETRALMAVQILAALTIANVKATPEEVFESSWSAVDRLIAAAPAGDTAQTAEPTEEEWEKAWFCTTDEPFLTYAARMTTEAHRLAALRVNTPGPEAAKDRV